MHKLLFLVVMIFITNLGFSQDLASGVWSTGEDNTMIETYQKDSAWYGKIISSDNSKAPLGIDILKQFIKENDEWVGKIYSVKKQKTMDAKIEVVHDQLIIKVSKGIIKKTIKWLKVST